MHGLFIADNGVSITLIYVETNQFDKTRWLGERWCFLTIHFVSIENDIPLRSGWRWECGNIIFKLIVTFHKLTDIH